MKKALRDLLCAAALAAALPVALAQGYPNQPIKLVVAAGPGTGSDIIARLLGAKIGESLNQSVVVENRPGAGGTIGSDAVARSPGDGYTLLLGSNAMLITSPLLQSPKAPYSVDKQFAFVGGVARTSMVMVTGTQATSPKNLAQLVELAKQGKSSYASAGNGSIGHVTTEYVLKKVGLAVTHIPYRGSSQSLTDVISGQVLFASDSPAAVLPLVRSGQLRAIAVTGDTRLQTLPDVPTFAEAGVPDVKVYAWWGLFAPAGTPRAVVKTLDETLAKRLADVEVRTRMAQMDLEIFPATGEQLAPFVKNECGYWQQFLSQAGIKLE
jgi:tripartite-type tricarboxylate transporter receptor subunit TctC